MFSIQWGASLVLAAVSMAGAQPPAEPGRTLHVTLDGGAEADGASWETAVSLGEALRRARPGDTVRLKAGVYGEALDAPASGNPGFPIVFEGERGPDGKENGSQTT